MFMYLCHESLRAHACSCRHIFQFGFRFLANTASLQCLLHCPRLVLHWRPAVHYISLAVTIYGPHSSSTCLASAQGDNLFQLLGTRLAPSSASYMLLAALIMVPTVWLPDLKSLSYLGFVGISATLTVTAAVAFTLLTGTRGRISCRSNEKRLHCVPVT